jgi:dTDP-4-amino-4,6-dideoxygalactose transaminase
MYKEWPLDEVPKHLQRPELDLIKKQGYKFNDPWEVVDLFEQKVAEFSGAKYAVAVDCCSHGLFLCLKYLKATGTITIPSHTYASVPMQIIHAGCKVKMVDQAWIGSYQLKPYPIWDSAIQWRRNMYAGGFSIVSFQIKKAIPIGRGGMILTDDQEAVNWLKKSRYDGRTRDIPYVNDNIEQLGWHMYMTPEDAARGILLMDARPQDWPDRNGRDYYVDLLEKKIFKDYD